MAKRIFYKGDNFKIVEFTPQPRTMNFHFERVENFGKVYKAKHYLGLPYVQCAQFNHPEQGSIFFASFSKKPLVSLDDAVGLPLLPNVHADLSVSMDVYGDIDASIEAFFSSYFNDRDDNFWPGINGVKELFGNYANWELKTRVDSKFILNSPLLRPTSPVIDGIQLERTIRYSDIPKMKNFMVHANKNNDNDDNPVDDLLDELDNDE